MRTSSVIVLFVIQVWALSVQGGGHEFTLKEVTTGASYGPFSLTNGVTLIIENSDYLLLIKDESRIPAIPTDPPSLLNDEVGDLVRASQSYLQIKFNTNAVKIVRTTDASVGSYSDPSYGTYRWGQHDVLFSVGASQPRRLRLQLIRSPSGWHVYRELKNHQLFEGHPMNAWMGDTGWIKYRAALAFEESLAA